MTKREIFLLTEDVAFVWVLGKRLKIRLKDKYLCIFYIENVMASSGLNEITKPRVYLIYLFFVLQPPILTELETSQSPADPRY